VSLRRSTTRLFVVVLVLVLVDVADNDEENLAAQSLLFSLVSFAIALIDILD